MKGKSLTVVAVGDFLCYNRVMDHDAELARIATNYHLWDYGYVIDAIEEIVLNPDWDSEDQIVLIEMVLAKRQEIMESEPE